MEATQLAVRARVAMVWPASAEVGDGIADLRAVPDDGAELVDQAHLGERMRILGERDAWRYIQGEDGYFGWIRKAALRSLDAPRGAHVVAALVAPVRAAADPHAAVIGFVPAGTLLPAPRHEDRGVWLETTLGNRRGHVAAEDTELVDDLPRRPPLPADLIASAEAFRGAPYLWGGTTAFGLDCSGFVQQVYRLNGVALPRDADQQALFGRPVERASAGDLFFFGADAVTHVALALGEREFLHAPQTGAFVERGRLGPERRLRAIRRYLPEPET